MRGAVLATILSVVLVACSGSPQAEEATMPQPPQALREQFSDCTWGEVRAGGVSIWSFACADQRLAGDDAIPGFVREEGERRTPVIWLFAKAPEAPIEATLQAIRAASPGSESCMLEPISGQQGRYRLLPTGAARRAYDAFIAGVGDGPALPCGQFGPSEGGMVIIQVVDGAPDTVAVIATPSDIPIFDWNTLRAAR